MTAATAQNTNGGDADAAQQAWRSVRDAADIQFTPLPPFKPVPVETPGWLKLLGELLQAIFKPLGRALGVSWPVFEKVLLGLAVLLVLFVAWRLLAPWIARLRQHGGAAPEAADWAPDRAEALALLEDADRLAREGRFAEAVHLLLRRSVRHIAVARPEWLRPASTAREIAALPTLPERARAAFTVIAARVERSRFARRDLDHADWDAARGAYADFALADLRG